MLQSEKVRPAKKCRSTMNLEEIQCITPCFILENCYPMNKQQQNLAKLRRDVEQANPHLSAIFDKEKEQQRLKTAQLLGEIGNQASDIACTEGAIAAEKAQRNPQARETAKAALVAKGNLSPTERQITEQARHTAMADYGTGSALQQGMQAATAAIQGLAGGDLKSAIAGGSAPYLAEVIKKSTPDESSRVMAHAVVAGALAQMQGNNPVAGAAGAATGEIAASVIKAQLYPDKKVSALSESEKQTVSTLSTLASGLAGGIAGDSTASAVAGAQAGKTVVENNYLSNAQQSQKAKELAECQTLACKAGAQAKWTAINLGQDGSFAAGMVTGVPAALYEAVDGIVKAGASPLETYTSLKALFNSGDVLGNVSEAVKTSYIARIDKMEAEYQKAGASGSFNAGVEGGKLVADVASLVAGGAGIVKGGAALTEKIAATITNKQIIKAAEKISTAKPGKQFTAPRDLNEQIFWKQTQSNPKSGNKLDGMNNDPRFPKSAGFQKMEATHKLPDGSAISIHYQYNSNTGKAYDMKIITPQRNSLQPGASITEGR